ncbi:MAG: threonine ammonia-lyase, biosynthetic [Gammaproteobacteria bacterium]|nr:threonine ammonia-lyase, biosynthetic [Gammaproteobacteria bacterium]MCY4200936.1 threonine ammonia-lyase, biosynthetic [Gammaproteobacteria bacterium]MCY4279077.1 threonine ammonia-lyase, biosynthetic [Gammaproteobacteria bacterium]MCY4323408.1 threonine ammonia-lyase, biosynthetic [Gammaproteobacteria bacterium]
MRSGASTLDAYAKRIDAARIYDVAIQSPLQAALKLTRRTGNQVLLKREDLQPVHSFKIRGALNKIAHLSEAERARGVVTASAGNHAQGVALAARRLGLSAVIVMGKNTPEIKVEAVRAHGAHIVFEGESYDEAAVAARRIEAQEGRVFVPPYDDADVIAGQGTVGVELLEACEAFDAVYVPVGGGGLIAGVAEAIKAVRPEVKVIGVEAEGSACMSAALEAGTRVVLKRESMDMFADGVSVAQVGEEPFRVARDHVDAMVTVSTDEICAAIKDVFEDVRAIAEPAGALAVAGLKRHVQSHGLTDNTLIAIVSGANVNFDRLRYISEVAEFGERQELVLSAEIPEERGSFRRFCQELGHRSITEFNYRYAGEDSAQVYVGLRIHGEDERSSLLERLKDAGYRVVDMTDNDLAKLHVRHMVGGRVGGVKQELIYRIEFPERIGALRRFLSLLGPAWNITMFHYRNHGAAWGRVLVGFEAGDDDRACLTQDLDRVGYRYAEESDNPAYAAFLR